MYICWPSILPWMHWREISNFPAGCQRTVAPEAERLRLSGLRPHFQQLAAASADPGPPSPGRQLRLVQPRASNPVRVRTRAGCRALLPLRPGPPAPSLQFSFQRSCAGDRAPGEPSAAPGPAARQQPGELAMGESANARERARAACSLLPPASALPLQPRSIPIFVLLSTL